MARIFLSLIFLSACAPRADQSLPEVPRELVASWNRYEVVFLGSVMGPVGKSAYPHEPRVHFELRVLPVLKGRIHDDTIVVHVGFADEASIQRGQDYLIGLTSYDGGPIATLDGRSGVMPSVGICQIEDVFKMRDKSQK